MERELIVRGRGEALSLPDRAVIDVLVDAEGTTREQAYNEAAASARQVDAALAARGGAVARVITAVLMVHPKSRWKKGESVRTGWRASRGTTVEVIDFSQLGDLISELTTAGGAISGPAWRLDDTNPIYREARRLAAEDARRRAEDYAGALGLRIEEIAWIAEPGLRGSGDDDRMRGPMAVGGAAPGYGGEATMTIDITPDEIATYASVEASFRFASDGT